MGTRSTTEYVMYSTDDLHIRPVARAASNAPEVCAALAPSPNCRLSPNNTVRSCWLRREWLRLSRIRDALLTDLR